MMLTLKLLGGLGVFLFGMRIMSTGLQKVAGRKLRELLACVPGTDLRASFPAF